MSEYHSFDFDLADLSSAGKHWTLKVPRSLLRGTGAGLVDGVAVTCSDAEWKGSVQRIDAGFQLKGFFSLSIERRCDRCLDIFDWFLKEESQRDFRVGSVVESDDEDLDAVEVLSPPGHLNLIDLLREEIWLAWRPVAVCSTACKGLCSTCGQHLNGMDCRCSSQDDNHPFAALGKLKT